MSISRRHSVAEAEIDPGPHDVGAMVDADEGAAQARFCGVKPIVSVPKS